MGSHQQTTKMGEGSKQVRVDNWGIFFLQRLQMFFNKTDYCDLTLQFEGNVQLKVHRLVMNACTEYFQVLEQTCEMVDDTLIMPSDLQADVVLPIVNFMYTGMLEFHMSIFDKLYKTANLMNITVLTKLLDAQKTPIAPLPKPTNKRSSQIPHTWNLQGKKISAKTTDPDLPAPLPGRKLPVWKRKSAPSAIPHTVVPHFYPEQKRMPQTDPLAGFDNTPKPTRFEWPEEELSTLNLFDSTFDDISYTSKPLLTQDDEPRPSTSFDRIKETPDTNRRPANYSNSTVDMEDVKDYVKEQRIRSNMTEDDDDDEEAISNDFGNKDESLKRKMKYENTPAKRVRFSVNEKENQIKQTKINITPTGKTTSADVEHTKIISELLKKYPNLVKKNKNIRLKILAKSNNTPVVTAAEQNRKPIYKKASPRLQTITATPTKLTKASINEEKNEEDGPWKCQRCSTPSDPVEFVLYYLYRKHMTDVHNEKFDSRMCKFCGHKSTKHNMLMYHQYTKHGVKPPPAYNFPKCNQCPYIALTETLLVRHKMNHTKYELQCVECKVTFMNQVALTSHVQITGHTGKSEKPNFDCQYCIKKFSSTPALFAHIRMLHRDEARRDGIVSIDEIEEAEEDDIEQDENVNEEEEEDDEEYNAETIIPDKKDKIKILSDVKLPSMDVHQSTGSNALTQQNITLEPSSEAEALSNVASGIATSLGLVDVVVLDENQQYILHTDNQQGMASGESEFILPDFQDTQTLTTTQQVITSEQNVITQSMLHNSDIGSTDELVMVLTDHDYGDGNNEIINNENSNIVVLYSHPIEGQENQFITSQGNLMLTSQAGLIELRNGNAVVTSTAPHFITTSADTSDNSHIESIEMIQREINQHPNQIHLVEDIKPNLVQQVATANTVSVPTTIQALPQHSSEDVDRLQENEEHVQFNTLQDIVPTEQNNVEQDVQETNEMQEKNDNEVNEEQEVTDTSGVMEEESSGNVEEMQQDNETNIQVQQEQPESEENVNESNAVDQPECPETTEESNQNENTEKEPDQESTTQVVETSEQAVEESPNETAVETVPQQEQETAESNNDNVETTTREEANIEENPEKGEDTSEKCQELNESLSEEQLNQSSDVPMDEDTSHVTGDSNLNESGELSELNESEDLPKAILEGELEKSSEVQPKETNTSKDESVSNLKDESSKPGDESTNSQDDTEEATKQQDESLHSIDENSKTEENDDSSQPSDENSQLQDENSQTSHTSIVSTSNRPIYPHNNSNQSAKIILDDWEDTDSQQSDSKNGTTVNKLIDDWDDDEEDNKKGAG